MLVAVTVEAWLKLKVIPFKRTLRANRHRGLTNNYVVVPTAFAMSNASELTGLLDARKGYRDENSKAHRTVWSALTATVLVALLVLLVFKDSLPEVLIPWVGGLPKDPSLAALHIMKKAPIIV